MEALENGREPDRPVLAIDYELMERVMKDDPERHVFVAANCSFFDFGNLAALANDKTPDESGNRTRGSVVVEACHDCTIVSEPPRRVRVRGLEGVVVGVGAEGNVLVASDRATGSPSTVELVTRRETGVTVRTVGVDVVVHIDEDEIVVPSPERRAFPLLPS